MTQSIGKNSINGCQSLPCNPYTTPYLYHNTILTILSLSNSALSSSCTCLSQCSGQWHPNQPSRVLETFAQGFLHQLQAAVLMPHGQLQALHATDNSGPLLRGEEAPLTGQVHHEGHVNVHCLPMQQRRQYLLQHNGKTNVQLTNALWCWKCTYGDLATLYFYICCSHVKK